MYYNHIAFAERIARKHSNDHQHLVVALQIRGGNVINWGVNSIRYRRDFSYFQCSIHAEVDLVSKSTGLKGSKVCVYRFNRAQGEGDPRTSQPCPLCANLLAQAGVSRVVFQLDSQVISCHPMMLPMVYADPVSLTNHYAKVNGSNPDFHFDLKALTRSP